MQSPWQTPEDQGRENAPGPLQNQRGDHPAHQHPVPLPAAEMVRAMFDGALAGLDAFWAMDDCRGKAAGLESRPAYAAGGIQGPAPHVKKLRRCLPAELFYVQRLFL